MLAPLFSREGRYRRYAFVLAGGLLVYLFGGFLLAKWLFTGAAVHPSPAVLVGLPVGAVLFALIHISSMKQLDSVRSSAGSQKAD